ncbi:RNA-binding S4 domain-containing protein [Leifsonia xyli]|uniref:RNA-binding S4 domain-containing protein n=1 Tax=Leifsonia xyli TaxID=1575 RepID=UPI001CB7D17E|nr:S4 domain-containing protein [Leifsonia xyli]
MAGPASVRVDSWTWAVRLFKTRSSASDACKAGHLKVNGDRAKPAQPVKVGDEIRALAGGSEKVYIARRLIVKRVGAAVAADAGTAAGALRGERGGEPMSPSSATSASCTHRSR